MPDPRTLGAAKTANQILLDEAIRRGISVERLKNQIVHDVVGFLNDQLYPEVLALLSKRLDRITVRGSDSGVWGTQRYQDLVAAVRDSIDESTKEVRALYLERAIGAAKSEAEWATAGLSDKVAQFGLDVTKPSATLLRAIVSNEPFEGQVTRDWFDSLAANTQRGVIRAVDLGLAAGETVDQMVARVRGTKAKGYTDGAFQASRNQAEAIVRTGVQHVVARSREQTYSENSDLIDGVQWIATLDHKTCPICAALDGKVFETGQGHRPPAHWNCRCTTVPALKSWKALGIDLKEAPPGTRASMDGEVPDTITFGEWLKTQPNNVQDDVLGVGAAKEFRSGRRAIDEFSNEKGHVLTLEELAKLN